MALWGFWTNFVFLILTLISWSSLSSKPRLWSRVAFLFAILIAASSVVMGLVSFLYLNTYCLFCIGAYVASALQLLGTVKDNQSHQESFVSDLGLLFTQGRGALASFVAIPVLAFVSNAMILDSYGAGKLDIIVQESLNDWSSAQSVEFDTTKGLVFQSTPQTPAKVTVVEFIDLLCPHCKMASPTIHAFVEGRPDAQLIVKIFPLDGTCNPEIKRAGDGVRCTLAYQVLCAEKLNQKGWAALKWVFEHQQDFFSGDSTGLITKMQQYLGLSEEGLKACQADPETMNLVTFMANEGTKAQIRGTPAVFLNGKMVDKGQVVPVLEAIYQKAKSNY